MPSKIGNKGQVYYTNSDTNPGSYWSSSEKETFFHYLSRYSIHQIDLIKQFLPSKSTTEIQCYYNVLKLELSRRKKTGKPKYYSYKINKVKYRIKLWRFPKGLMKYDDLPSAYEMSEEFIKLEEYQSDYIAMREARIDNDNFVNVKRSTSKHIEWGDRTEKAEIATAPQPSMSFREYGISVYKPLVDLPPFTEPSQYESLGKDGFLTSFQKAGRLSEMLYVNNGITQKTSTKLALEFPAQAFFDEIVRLIVRKILLAVFEKKTLSNRSGDTIHDYDIHDAVSTMSYKDPEALFNMNEYFGNLDKRLHCSISDDYTNGRQMTHNEFYNFMALQAKSHDVNNIRQTLNANNDTLLNESKFTKMIDIKNPFIEDSEVNQDQTEPNSIVHIGELKKSREILTLNDVDEEILVDKLNKMEETRLSRQDKYNSLMHETGLLTYMMTNREQDIEDRIYNTEEGEEILQFWQNEEESKRIEKRKTDQIEKRKRFEYELYRDKLLKHAEYVKRKREEMKNAQSQDDVNHDSGYDTEHEDMSLDDLEIFDPDHMDVDDDGNNDHEFSDELTEPSLKLTLSRALLSNYNYTFPAYNSQTS
jgi:RNA polymerase I-specific transcription initiation factor RRN5